MLGEFGEDAPGVVLVDALDRAQVVENHRSTIVNVIEISCVVPASGQATSNAVP